MKKIGLETPRSMLAHNTIEALQALDVIGLPCIIRPSFTLGGTGGGFFGLGHGHPPIPLGEGELGVHLIHPGDPIRFL